MSTLIPPLASRVQDRTTRAVEGRFWGVQAEIWELERKFEVADGKTHAHYHEQLEKLK